MTALSVNRGKGRTRNLRFLQEEDGDEGTLWDVLSRHNLTDAWQKFCDVTGTENDLHPSGSEP